MHITQTHRNRCTFTYYTQVNIEAYIVFFILVWCDNPGWADRKVGRPRKHCTHRAIALPLPYVPQLWDPQVCLNPLFMCFINVGLWDFQRSQVSAPAWELVTARVSQGFTWLTSPFLTERYWRYSGDFAELFSGGNCACIPSFL